VGSSFVSYGVRIGLRASGADGLQALKGWLPRAVKPSRATVVQGLYSLILGGAGPRSGVKRFHVLYRDAQRLARSLDLDEIRRTFDRDISMLVGEAASRRVFVHAGVVGFKGGAVVVPGKSFSGKTTLIQALVAQGGVYYSDEYAVLDARGRVFPWAEPLSIRPDGARKRGQSHSPDSLGIVAGRISLPVRLVVLTSFEKGRRFRPRKLTPAAGTLGLLEHTLPARKRPRAALRALTSAVSDAQVIRGPRGEAREAARAIVRLLDAPRTL
jgi:hypothetical protein